MTEPGSLPDSSRSPEEEFGDPRGTVVIVFIFGALFAIGWFAMYFLRFLGRGAPSA
jgi:hypothetical protein